MVFAATPLNTPTLENGSYFYFTAGTSIGFAPNSTVVQGSADTQDAFTCNAGNGGDLRLSWHLTGVGGWRAGCSIGLNASPEPRAVYQSSSSSSLFTGPAKNVSHQTLLDNGWSLCYDDTYAFGLASDGSDLTSACTQTYVLLAGGDGVAGPQPFPSASSPAEAEVEAGPPGIALTVPNALGRDSAGLPIYFGSHKTSSYGAYSLELTGPQGRTVLASGKSSVYGGYVGIVRLPAGLPGGSYVLSLKNTSAAGIPLVLKVNLTLDASSRLQSHSPG